MMAFEQRVSPDSMSICYTSDQKHKLRYTHFRADGWPLCPQCDEDELYSHLMLVWDGTGERPSVEECLHKGMTCYLCHWSSE